ncbi:hypothetical protein RUM44_008640 [Polyplax serrata]|uniref:Uncharacterized protein n=1 Tax=Polyplax serrata TaxID=468196 RepID=A0ABR1BCV1_POLSC
MIDGDEINLLRIQSETSLSSSATELSPNPRGNVTLSETGETPYRILPELVRPDKRKAEEMVVSVQGHPSTTEDRQRTGRYLAVGLIIVMVFLTFYHTLMKHTTVLTGLLAPAIIMLLYILWLFYFARKRKRQVGIV